MKNIAVLDYGIGNVRSVNNALRAVGANSVITSDAKLILNSDGLIIPGVGAFPQGMENLIKLGLVDLIGKYIETGRPVLGICLGMQLLLEKGSEFLLTPGLGYVKGSVDIIPLPATIGRLPHIAWSNVSPTQLGYSQMFAGLTENELRFYFVHSYAASGVLPINLCATTNYHGLDIVAAVQSKNVWGTQFHPEKSGPNGLKVLKNFIYTCCSGDFNE